MPPSRDKTLIMGHPPAVWDRILLRLENGESLNKITAEDGYPRQATVYRLLEADPVFSEKYARARARQADTIAEEALQSAITAVDPATGRLAFDARRWFAGKVAPKKWGERNTVDLNLHHDPANMTDADLAAIAAGKRPAPASKGEE